MFRGLEVVEQACGVGTAMMGETLGGVANGVDTYSYREPLGVCAGMSFEYTDKEKNKLHFVRICISVPLAK